jgi:hypothetical protein
MTRMAATVPDTARAARAQRGIASPGGERSNMLRNMGPENVAPWVAYLASDAAKDVNGQVFFVMGGIIALMNEPAPVRTISHDGRWTPEEIATVFSRTLGADLVNPAPVKDSGGA